MSYIKHSTFKFLKQLSAHNNRDWFNAHKGEYLSAKENVEQFVDALILKMSRHDSLETLSGKKSLYRIYNDVRFAKDKAPYTAKFSGYLRRTKPHLRGGYYFRFKPGNSRVACGFAYPNPEDLMRFRQDININYEEWQKLLKQKGIRTHFGKMFGDQVKTSPRGFEQTHPAIELLRYKQYWFERTLTDREVLAADFLNQIDNTFRSIRPFFDYASYVLGTDLNGEERIV